MPTRRPGQVPFTSSAPVVVTTLPASLSAGALHRVVIVKASFALSQGGPARPLDAPRPLSGDVRRDPEASGGSSLAMASDFVVHKPRVDVLVLGHAIAPTPGTTSMRVAFHLGEGPSALRQELRVHGDRTWRREGARFSPGPAAPFERLPLVWERALGGPGSRDNPVGRGRGAPGAPDARLPNLEDPRQPLTSPDDAPPPRCWAPVAPDWPARRRGLGTYDAAWQRARWPYLPLDFDHASQQAAPPFMQRASLVGDEPFVLEGMHAEHRRFEGSLPGWRLRAFGVLSSPEKSPEGSREGSREGSPVEPPGARPEAFALVEVGLSLDTVCFDVDAGVLDLVWRGALPVTTHEAHELCDVYVLRDEAPLSLADVRARYLDERAPEPAPPRLVRPALPPLPTPPPSLRAEVLRRLAAREPLVGMSLAGLDLSGVDAARASLARAKLTGVDLRGARLEGAVLDGAQLAGARLDGAHLAGASLAGADLTGARLDGADLSGACLEGADLSGCALVGARLVGASAARAVLVEATLTGAVLDDATLTRADLSRAVLDGASLARVSAEGVTLFGASGEQVIFDGARLDDARADDVRLPKASLVGASLRGAVLARARLDGARLVGATLDEAGLEEASLEGASLAHASARGARLTRAKLSRADLRKIDLMGASLEAATLDGADLTGASLYRAETWRASLRGAKLDGAKLSGTKLARGL